MFYKNNRFILNTSDRSVRDENDKQLYITGNAYIMLEFLCKHGPATVTDISDAIDYAAQLDENDVRQLRHKIKTAVGHDIILYKNHIYSIDGGTAEAATNERPATPAIVPVKDETPQPQKTENNIASSNNTVSKFNMQIIIFVAIVLLIIVSVGSFLIFRKHKTNVATNKALIVNKPQDDMVLIPAGNFIMGSTETQALAGFQMCEEQNQCIKEDYLSEYPQQTVNLPDFYIDKQEVSNADYKLFMRTTNHSQPQYLNDSNLNQDSEPVVGVNWYDAQAYCQWVNKSLPTEAEIEKAARGTDGRIWPWGNTWDGTKVNHGIGGEPGLDSSDGYNYSAPVGISLGVSPYGVLDMAGNVSEWTQDNFGPYQGNNKYSHPLYGQGLKVVKGGAYDTDQSTQRTAARYYYEPSSVDLDLGFRCAR
jgi:formylglycine-generating enzyme required for sulfatase activity